MRRGVLSTLRKGNHEKSLWKPRQNNGEAERGLLLYKRKRVPSTKGLSRNGKPYVISPLEWVKGKTKSAYGKSPHTKLGLRFGGKWRRTTKEGETSRGKHKPRLSSKTGRKKEAYT